LLTLTQALKLPPADTSSGASIQTLTVVVAVGVADGVGEGVGEGDGVGDIVGDTVGDAVGDIVGDTVGESVGDMVGDTLGVGDGVGAGATCRLSPTHVAFIDAGVGVPSSYTTHSVSLKAISLVSQGDKPMTWKLI